VEEQALYRAILAAPHDDAPRLVYADWLDENADRFPEMVGRSERARAEFIRLQRAIARSDAAGWKAPAAARIAPALLARQKRLLSRNGRKWRRAHPVVVASAPFDRGFLRPFRALRPQQFLRHAPFHDALSDSLLLAVPHDSPARRYLPEDDLFATCPLWDVHLFASDWHNDPLADRGQYEGLLASVGRSPALARVGWLKVSFFHTPTAEFLRTGNFANVETLVLNCVPFPEVLEAVAENESFRSLRYVHLGDDHFVWAGDDPAVLQYYVLADRLRQANERHLPHGEMRAALRAILNDQPAPAFTFPVVPPSVPPVSPAPVARGAFVRWALAGQVLAVAFVVSLMRAGSVSRPDPQPQYKFDYDPDKYKIPPGAFEAEKLLQPAREPPRQPVAPEPGVPRFVTPQPEKKE
jgi:uncharacterized protein (TIGR02996 family)